MGKKNQIEFGHSIQHFSWKNFFFVLFCFQSLLLSVPMSLHHSHKHAHNQFEVSTIEKENKTKKKLKIVIFTEWIQLVFYCLWWQKKKQWRIKTNPNTEKAIEVNLIGQQKKQISFQFCWRNGNFSFYFFFYGHKQHVLKYDIFFSYPAKLFFTHSYPFFFNTSGNQKFFCLFVWNWKIIFH